MMLFAKWVYATMMYAVIILESASFPGVRSLISFELSRKHILAGVEVGVKTFNLSSGCMSQ